LTTARARHNDGVVDGILRAPAAIVFETGLPMSTAVGRLVAFLADQPRIEPATSGSSDRRLIGQLDGSRVQLAIWDANILSRRKSWNLEFRGAFTSTPTGAVLSGAIDIPDRPQLRAVMRMIRIASAFTAILAIGIDVRDSSMGRAVALMPAVAAVAIAVGAVLVTRQMEVDGGRQAEDDAMVLAAAVERLFRE
jgi:hypothetical protein